MFAKTKRRGGGGRSLHGDRASKIEAARSAFKLGPPSAASPSDGGKLLDPVPPSTPLNMNLNLASKSVSSGGKQSKQVLKFGKSSNARRRKAPRAARLSQARPLFTLEVLQARREAAAKAKAMASSKIPADAFFAKVRSAVDAIAEGARYPRLRMQRVQQLKANRGEIGKADTGKADVAVSGPSSSKNRQADNAKPLVAVPTSSAGSRWKRSALAPMVVVPTSDANQVGSTEGQTIAGPFTVEEWMILDKMARRTSIKSNTTAKRFRRMGKRRPVERMQPSDETVRDSRKRSKADRVLDERSRGDRDRERAESAQMALYEAELRIAKMQSELSMVGRT